MTANENSPSAPKEPTDTTDAQPNGLDAATTVIGAEPAWTHVAATADDRTSVKVRAEFLELDRGSVGLTTNLAGGEVSISLEPDDARALAAKLRSAAAYAEDGDR
jgi:hypothetical protein